METKHTPGPWYFRPTHDPNSNLGGLSFTIENSVMEWDQFAHQSIDGPTEPGWVQADDNPHYTRIAMTTDGAGTAFANAHLIASAPDLYRIVAAIDTWREGGSMPSFSSMMPDGDETFGEAIASALAKSEGGA